MAEWIAFKQYAGMEILNDASKIRINGVEQDLRPGKAFYFVNPNTGTKNFAKPDVLLNRALKEKKEKVAKVPKEKKAKEPKAPKEKKVPKSKPAKTVVENETSAIQKSALNGKITLTGKEALQKAIDTKCDLYYKTKSWGWYISKRDPVEMMKEIESALASGNDVKYPYENWGVL